MQVQIYKLKLCLFILIFSVSVFVLNIVSYSKTKKLISSKPEIYILESEDDKEFEVNKLKRQNKHLIVLTKSEKIVRDKLIEDEKQLNLTDYLSIFAIVRQSNRRVYQIHDNKNLYLYEITNLDNKSIYATDKEINYSYSFKLGNKYDIYKANNKELLIRQNFINLLKYGEKN